MSKPASTETTPLDGAASKTLSSSSPEGPNYPRLIVTLTVFLGIGFALAYGSFVLDGHAELYATKFHTIAAMELQWIFLALVVLGRTISLLNFVPTGYKKGMKGNIRSNPFFLETDDNAKTMVVFKEDGPLGAYNRTNRSVHHMIENSGGLFAGVAAIGWVFPRPVFVWTVVFCLGRVFHQKGYSQGYGGHALGFAASLFSTVALEGLALLTFFKGQGWM